jgi:glycosyltransferase involved in cell wall biosynthesis
MRIAQVSPLYESVPPKLYGGTERVVFNLTEELVRQGHDVTLFASGDSRTSAKLIAPCPKALRLDANCRDQMAYHMVLLDQVFAGMKNFDIVHFHIDYLHYPFSRGLKTPHITTLHGRLDLPELATLYRRFPDVPLVSISDAQRRPIAWANWQGTVYHGLPRDLYEFHPASGSYLAFIGRISPEKRVDRAIEIAGRSGLPLKIAAKVDPADRKYYEQEIRSLMDRPGVEFIGEIGEHQKSDFLGNALALLFPIDWPEPFGLVMIESMACGTPVVAWPCGSVPEVIDEGITGFICDSMDEAAETVARVNRLDRAICRRQFESRFLVGRMAKDYVEIYKRLISKAKPSETAGDGRSHPGPGSVLHSGDRVAHS